MQVTFGDIFTHWNAAELDLHEVFGVDVESGILSHRSWRWLKIRLLDLLGSPTRLAVALGLADRRGTLI